ncbi:MAG: calpastatin [Rhizobium sp.]|nr:calpastatin [Rhizobium sp.]
MAHADPYDLDRFVLAQAPVYDMALAELIGGKKLSHWMWFVFPQLRGLGRSPTAQQFGIDTLDEARAYLAHPVLGTRLRECVNAVLDCGETSLHEIFGSPDDMKFRSSMTFYALAAQGDGEIFEMALAKFCGGRKDEQTLALLNISA